MEFMKLMKICKKFTKIFEFICNVYKFFVNFIKSKILIHKHLLFVSQMAIIVLYTV